MNISLRDREKKFLQQSDSEYNLIPLLTSVKILCRVTVKHGEKETRRKS